MKIRGIDFVMYQVSDLAEAARFYRETLGLAQETYNEEWQWAEFDCGNVTLCLHGGMKLPANVPGGRIALSVDNVQAAYAELKEKGVRMVGEPVDYSVCCALELLDPDGNPVILHQRADGTCGQGTAHQDNESDTIIAIEQAALDRWGNGDPSGFLELCAPDVVYFDNTLERRLDGLEALKVMYGGPRGKVRLEGYKLLNPKVQLCGESAVLTYNFLGRAQAKSLGWNCTEVYRKDANHWRIIQTHWSLTGRPTPTNPLTCT